MSQWVDGLSQIFLSGPCAPRSNFKNTGNTIALNASGDQKTENIYQYIFYRAGQVGIAKDVTGFGKLVYVHLYKARNPYSNNIRNGFYYLLDQPDQIYRYNPSQYGTKSWRDFLAVPGGQGSERPAVPISSSTAAIYGSPLGIPGDLILSGPEAWLKAIATQPYSVPQAAFRNEIKRELITKGYSTLEVEAYLRARDDVERGNVKQVADARIKRALDSLFSGQSSSGSGGSGGRAGGGSSNGSNPSANYGPISYPKLQTRLVVRMPGGFQIPDQAQLSATTAPAIHQTFLDKDGKSQSYVYEFDYIPQNIQYSSLGSEWVEIPRAENFPYVDWNRFQLMRVSMSWVVATDRVETGGAVVPDGMFESVDENLMTLRRMAQRKYPVTIVNMDDLLSVKLVVDRGENGEVRSVSGMQFVITDLSFTAARRTSDTNISGGPATPSKIAVAQCQMTLQEVPIESVQIVTFPRLEIPFTPPGRAPSSNPMAGSSFVLASSAKQTTPSTSWATTAPE